MSVGQSITSSPERERQSRYIPRAKTPGVCGSCGKPFMGRPDQKWCARSCGARKRNPPKPPREKVRPSRTCVGCGTAYLQKDYRPTDYCSRSCKARSTVPQHQPTALKCQHCEKEFLGFVSHGRFCSDDCKAKSLERVCSRCGKGFASVVPGSHLCSEECRLRHHNPTQAGTIECVRCGTTIHVSKSFSARRKYCSIQCMDHVTRKTAKYRRRARVKSQPSEIVTIRFLLARDKGVCQLCKKIVNRKAVAPEPDSPTIDHVIPLAKGGSHTKTNTQLACFGCNTSKGDQVDTLF